MVCDHRDRGWGESGVKTAAEVRDKVRDGKKKEK